MMVSSKFFRVMFVLYIAIPLLFASFVVYKVTHAATTTPLVYNIDIKQVDPVDIVYYEEAYRNSAGETLAYRYGQMWTDVVSGHVYIKVDSTVLSETHDWK